MQKNYIFSNRISGGIHMITPKLLCNTWMIQNKWAVLKYPNSIMSCVLKDQNSSFQFSSVAQSSDSLLPHGLQHTRPPCPSPTHGVYSNSGPLSRWCHPTISSSVVPFSSRLLSFLASGSFQMSQFFASDGQSFGVSTLASVLPMNI